MTKIIHGWSRVFDEKHKTYYCTDGERAFTESINVKGETYQVDFSAYDDFETGEHMTPLENMKHSFNRHYNDCFMVGEFYWKDDN